MPPAPVGQLAQVALVTDARYVEPQPGNVYVQNIFDEDALVIEALAARGVQAVRRVWSDPSVDWGAFAAVVLRTPWDYFDRYQEFLAWLDHVDERSQLINPLGLLHWNMDKHYLRDLDERGIRVVPTVYFEQGQPRSLREEMATRGWDDAVVKPVVSGAARHTYRVNLTDAHELQPRFDALVAEEAMMLQPFMPDIVNNGEVTLMMFGDRFTHAIIKRARPGDFRVQDDHGGTVHAYEASPDEIEFARAAFAACGWRPCYGRVDVVRDHDGELAVMELELVEPELWFRQEPAAAGVFADELVARLERP